MTFKTFYTSDLFFGFTSNDYDSVSVDQSNFTARKSFKLLSPNLSRHIATGSKRFFFSIHKGAISIGHHYLQTLVILRIHYSNRRLQEVFVNKIFSIRQDFIIQTSAFVW